MAEYNVHLFQKLEKTKLTRSFSVDCRNAHICPLQLLVFNRLFSADVLQSKEGEDSPLNGRGKIKSAQIVMKIRIYIYFCIVSGKIIMIDIIIIIFLSVPAP